MNKTSVQPRPLININWGKTFKIILPSTAGGIALIIGVIWGISGIKGCVATRAEHAQVRSVLNRERIPEIVIHQPNQIEVVLPRVEGDIDGKPWNMAEKRYILYVPAAYNKYYETRDGVPGLVVAIANERDVFGRVKSHTLNWFPNLTYEEWNAAVNQLNYLKENNED